MALVVTDRVVNAGIVEEECHGLCAADLTRDVEGRSRRWRVHREVGGRDLGRVEDEFDNGD